MTFNSLTYALFLPVVIGMYWLLPRRLRQPWLLGACYLFYGLFDWRFLGLLMFTTVVDYNVGKWLEHFSETRQRQRLLALSIAVNLGVLGFFKYANFFVDQATGLLHRFGMDATAPTLSIVLPYGISFYTFQSIAYTVDVYRRQVPACRRPIDFATFVAYFPQLVAGPISRAKNLLPQIQADRPRPERSRALSGVMLILLGLFKKVVIADPLAPVVAHAFGSTAAGGTTLMLAGMVGFAIQIYADFSGYSDIARGSSRLLGIELVHNFDQPYLSRSITEFWRRWHMSLSTWLRDYVYVPFGGNRGGKLRTYRNLMITMLLGGLWHGAAWTFVAWGGLHGAYLAIERATGIGARGAKPTMTGAWARVSDAVALAVTFSLVCIAWVFFRAANFSQALDVFSALARFGGTAPTFNDVALVLFATALAFGLDVLARSVRQPLGLVQRRPVVVGLLVGLSMAAIVVFSGATPVPFIYFQF